MPRVSIGKTSEVKNREQDLRSRYGGFMTRADVAAELGCGSHHTVEKFVSALPYFLMTGRKLYDIRDIARLIEDSRVSAEDRHGV